MLEIPLGIIFKFMKNRKFGVICAFLFCLLSSTSHAFSGHGGINSGILMVILLSLPALITTFIALLGNSIVKKIILFVNIVITFLIFISLIPTFDSFSLIFFAVPALNIFICTRGITIFGKVKNGELKQVKKYILNGGDINIKDKKGIPLLHYSAEAYTKDIAEFLIDNGADINARDNDGKTVLHIAVYLSTYYDKNELIRFLLSKGIDVNTKDNFGKTPLDYAQKTEVKQILVSHGAKSGKDL